MNSEITVPPFPPDCKEQTCPVCGKGTLGFKGPAGLEKASCGNPLCEVKSWGPMQLLERVSGDFRKTVSSLCVSMLGKAHASALRRLGKRIGNGVLDELADIGLPCRHAGKETIAAMGICNPAYKLENGVVFVHSNPWGTTACEDMKGELHDKIEQPGCFPFLPAGTKAVYVFPTAKDAVVARNIWGSAGLGTFPAYSFSGFSEKFPGPETKITFVNLSGRTAKPEMLAEAIDAGFGISVSRKIELCLDDLRKLLLSGPADPDVAVPDPYEGERIAGELDDGRPIFFREDGYYVPAVDGGKPEKQTNFTFEPTRVHATCWPDVLNLWFSTIRVNGEVVAENAVLHGGKEQMFLSAFRAIRALSPVPRPEAKNQNLFWNAKFSTMDAVVSKFPATVCACAPGDVVFPRFKLSADGMMPHPELFQMISNRRDGMDYVALEPERASKEDLAELARLMLCKTGSAELAALGLCAWLHMVASTLAEFTHKTKFPPLCFEIHGKSDEAAEPMSFLTDVFAGRTTAPSSAPFNRTKQVQSREMPGTWLPGFYEIGTGTKHSEFYKLFRRTQCGGLYSSIGSDCLFPMNARGNVQSMYVLESKEPVPKFDVRRVRRAVLHLLVQSAKLAKTAPPERWTGRKPEIRMYEDVAKAMRGLGVVVPGPDRFAKYERR